MDKQVKNVIIVGGGTAGWVSASLLVRLLGKSINITLIESDQIGIVGVGEATIPPIQIFNRAIGLDEADFIKQTKATIKLGIQFENWGKLGDSYMHAFGSIGKDFPFCSFHHFWNRWQKSGVKSNFGDYSLNYQAAKKNKFSQLDQIEQANLPGLVYAYHFDASLYAKYLRNFSKQQGVERIEGIISKTNLDPKNGNITSIDLQDGTCIEGDLFIDCSGFKGLLIEEALNTGYEDWSHWLPCDKAMAVPSELTQPINPYTRSIAHKAGWQWRIPLQHRTGNGIVYCSRYMSEDDARATLLGNLDGKPLAEPRIIPFRTGRRNRQWHRNCVSIGLSSGFLEPLESTSIHLIQSGIIRLIKNFPHHGISDAERDEYNLQSKVEFEQIRDFIILHYTLNQRHDSPFWQQCQRMELPDSLQRKIDLFRHSGKVFRQQDELFSEVAWQQVMIGQNLIPKDYHPIANEISDQQASDLMENLRIIFDQEVEKLPDHETFLNNYCNQ